MQRSTGEAAGWPDSRNAVLRLLDRGDVAALLPYAEIVSLDSGDILYEPDQPLDWVYFPLTSVLSIVNVMRDGRTVESDTVGCESVVGILHALGSPVAINRTFVQIAGEAIRLPPDRLGRQALKNPRLLNLLIRHTQINLAQAHQSVACNALHPVTARLCRWLLLSHDRTGSDVIRLTQDYLATMLGVQRTTVTQAMSVLKAARLIDYRRGKISVFDRDGIEKQACECYAVGQEQLKRLMPGVELFADGPSAD